MPDFVYYTFLNNRILDYAFFLIALIVSWVVIRILGKIFLKRFCTWAAQSKKPSIGTIAKEIKKYLLPAAYFAAFYMSTMFLALGPKLTVILGDVVIAFIILMGAVFISTVAIFIFNRYWESRQPNGDSVLVVKLISGVIKITVWGIAIVLFLDNIDVKVSSLLAGFGIGGIAVAFAAQTILTDLFCFVTIFFDRPFVIGDFIVAGEQMGTVEHIGVKTTRLRALNGEQLILSNKDLTNARIQNFKTMAERRVLFTLGVTYGTPHEKLKDIPALMKSLIENVADTRFGRCHFVSYGDFCLNFETAYFILSSDYDKYMDIHQEVNLGIKEAFEKSGIEFAFPTRTVHLSGINPINSSKQETL